jgi:nucleotide-binding universal stress UspA family protein
MYKRILVPLDGSPESEKALGAARSLVAESGDGHLILLRVQELPSTSSWTSFDVLKAQESEKEQVSQYLDKVKASLGLDSVETIVHPGPSPAQAIAEVAQSHNVDLVAMTCHGRSALHQFILGSQTEKTLRLARCSVLVVRDTPTD